MLIDPMGDTVQHSRFIDKVNTTIGRIVNSDFRKSYKTLKKSEEVYVFNGSKGDGKGNNIGELSTDGSKIYINYEFGETENYVGQSSLGNMYHETQHGVQFEKGEVGFAYNEESGEWNAMNYDIHDEINAVDAGFKGGKDTYIENETDASGAYQMEYTTNRKAFYGTTGKPTIPSLLKIKPGYSNMNRSKLNNNLSKRVQNGKIYGRPYKK